MAAVILLWAIVLLSSSPVFLAHGLINVKVQHDHDDPDDHYDHDDHGDHVGHEDHDDHDDTLLIARLPCPWTHQCQGLP